MLLPMRSFTRYRPSPAMAVALIALVAALTGSAIALPGKGRVDSGDIKNNSVRGEDLRNGGIGTADVKKDGLTGGDINERTLRTVPRASDAFTATHAANSSQLGGVGPEGYLKAPTEAMRLVGAPGNPGFQTGWANFGDGNAGAGFFIDQFGVVHLQGLVNPPANSATTPSPIFILPEGYRPSTQHYFHVAGSPAVGPDTGSPGPSDDQLDQLARIAVQTDGEVVSFESGSSFLSLEGVTFRAGT